MLIFYFHSKYQPSFNKENRLVFNIEGGPDTSYSVDKYQWRRRAEIEKGNEAREKYKKKLGELSKQAGLPPIPGKDKVEFKDESKKGTLEKTFDKIQKEAEEKGNSEISGFIMLLKLLGKFLGFNGKSSFDSEIGEDSNPYDHIDDDVITKLDTNALFTSILKSDEGKDFLKSQLELLSKKYANIPINLLLILLQKKGGEDKDSGDFIAGKELLQNEQKRKIIEKRIGGRSLDLNKKEDQLEALAVYSAHLHSLGYSWSNIIKLCDNINYTVKADLTGEITIDGVRKQKIEFVHDAKESLAKANKITVNSEKGTINFVDISSVSNLTLNNCSKYLNEDVAYKLVALAKAYGKPLTITSTTRSYSKQNSLNNSGNEYLTARGGGSVHHLGIAFDCNKGNDSRFIALAEEFGFAHPYPGNDPVHFELANYNKSRDFRLAMSKALDKHSWEKTYV